MMFIESNKRKLNEVRPMQYVAAVLLGIVLVLPSFEINAKEDLYQAAEERLESKDYKKAQSLFEQLANSPEFQIKAKFGLARVAFFTKELDDAEELIEEVLEKSSETPEHLFLAGRVAGQQAQNASIFTKMGYAKDAKKYFEKAQAVDPNHQGALIGLIRFHQQAPSMAGGDEEQIPGLLDRLRNLDKREAFNIEAPGLLKDGHKDKVISLYKAALESEDETCNFKFGFALMLAQVEMYIPALSELDTLSEETCKESPEVLNMKLYQVGKLAAESNSQLDRGLDSMSRYASLEQNESSIPPDWVAFRIA